MRLSVDRILSMQKDELPKEGENQPKEIIRYKSTPWCDYWEVTNELGKVIRKERYEPPH